MKSSNPHSGVYEADTSRTLDNNGGSPACNQGGVAIVNGVVSKGNGEAFLTGDKHTSLSIGGGQAGQGYPCVLDGSGCLNPWDVQSKHIQQPNGVAESLYSGECRYGGGESYVLDEPQTVCIEGNGQRASHYGDGYSVSDASYTLNTVEQHGVFAFTQNQREECRDLNDTAGGLSAEPGSHQQTYVLPFDTTQVTSDKNWSKPKYGDPCHPLASGAHPPSAVIGADLYNGAVTGNVAATLGANTGQSGNHAGPSVVAAGFSFGQSAKARSLGYEEEVSPTLRGGEGGNQKPCVLDAQPITMNPRPQSMVCQEDVAATLGAEDYKEPQMVYDARGNGDGGVCPTITGDHQNRITDYTAITVEQLDASRTRDTDGGTKAT